jgi:hypothetical protein
MLVALATVVVACLPVVLMNTEMAVLLALFHLRVESIAEVLAPSGQSNYVPCYPNEEIRCYDCHYCFRVVGSNSYYS